MDTKAQPLQAMSAWLLDHDGDIYGTDERERLRWYEGIAVAASVQWIVVPVVLAVAVWIGGRPVASASLAVALAFYLPMAIVNAYVAQRHVTTTPTRWSAKRIVVTVVTAVPFIALTAGLARAYGVFDSGSGPLIGGVVGGLLGMVVVFLGTLAVGRRRDDDDSAPLP